MDRVKSAARTATTSPPCKMALRAGLHKHAWKSSNVYEHGERHSDEGICVYMSIHMYIHLYNGMCKRICVYMGLCFVGICMFVSTFKLAICAQAFVCACMHACTHVNLHSYAHIRAY